MVVTDGSGDGATAYQVPLTYRARALAGADAGLIGTSEHGVLGHRWIYDGTRDPVLVAQLVALLQGAAEPQAQSVSNTPDLAVSIQLVGDGSLTVTRPPAGAAGRRHRPSGWGRSPERGRGGQPTGRGGGTGGSAGGRRGGAGAARRRLPAGRRHVGRRVTTDDGPPPGQGHDHGRRDRPTHGRATDPARAAGCLRPAAPGGHGRRRRVVPPGRRGAARRLGDQLECQPADRHAPHAGGAASMTRRSARSSSPASAAT